MTAKMPPVPPENTSPAGPGSKPDVPGRDETPTTDQKPPVSTQTGQAANTRINTTAYGHGPRR